MNHETPSITSLRLPIQAAPVERTLSVSSSFVSSEAGVAASGINWGQIAQTALSALPGILSMF
jgi:hypothetical protein